MVSGAWDSCGRRLVTGGVDRTARLLHVPSLTEKAQLEGHGGEVSRVRLHSSFLNYLLEFMEILDFPILACF